MKRWLFGVFTSLTWALLSTPAFAMAIYAEIPDAGSGIASAQSFLLH